jgi:cyclopropane fatty-acyl-phospholipid synthase-like methyltransferase
MVAEWALRRRERLDGLTDLLAYAPMARVLDIGCHRGLVGYEFVKLGAVLVHGCDLDPEAIKCARYLFYDVDAQSEFHVKNLADPDALDWCLPNYDIVLLLGMYHKLKRVMPTDRLEQLIEALAVKSTLFAWNGAAEEHAEIAGILTGMTLAHWSRLTRHPTAVTAVWRHP